MNVKQFYRYVFVFLLSVFVFTGCGSDNGGGEFVENSNNKIKTKGYLIDSPVEGANYICADGSEGLTDAKGMFECVDTPVTFKIGKLTLGTIRKFTEDSKVYLEDLLNLSRETYSDEKLKLLARLIQSLDDDKNIIERITITQSVRDSFNTEKSFKDLSEQDIQTLLGEAEKDFVPECGALLHLGANVSCDNDGGYTDVIVSESNNPPVAKAQAVTVDEDTKDNLITLAGTDADGDSLTYSLVAQPAHGAVTLSGNVAKYTPTANYAGADSFSFKVNDGTVDSSSVVVSITVTDVAEPVEEPALEDAEDQVYSQDVEIEPLVFTNRGGAVSSCSVTPNLPVGLSVTKEGTSCQISGTPTVVQTVSDYVVTGTNETGDDTATVNITVEGLERLSILAKNQSNGSAEVEKDIAGKDYIFRVYTDVEVDLGVSQDAIVVYGKVDEEYVTVSINNNYPTNGRFQIRVFDLTNKEVGASGIVDYASVSIDVGAIGIK
jgi:hypothetical protein